MSPFFVMKHYYFALMLFLLVSLCGAISCTPQSNPRIDDILELEVHQISFAGGKTFVEMSITNKTDETIEIGATERSEEKTRSIKIVKGCMILDEKGNGYESPFLNQPAVYSLSGNAPYRFVAVFDVDLRHAKLKELSWVITYFKQGGKEYYFPYDLRVKLN